MDTRADRLGREELSLMQRKALREWQESNWLAEHKPHQWQALSDDGMVRVDLGSGIGESQQEPGYIALDKETMSRSELMSRSGESRVPDLPWDLHQGLPFEDGSIDAFNVSFLLRDLPDHAVQSLAKEMHRTLRTAGRVHLHEDHVVGRRLQPLLLDHGFAIEPTDRQPDRDDSPSVVRVTLAKVTSTGQDMSPLREKEHALGTLQIREPRQPIP